MKIWIVRLATVGNLLSKRFDKLDMFRRCQRSDFFDDRLIAHDPIINIFGRSLWFSAGKLNINTDTLRVGYFVIMNTDQTFNYQTLNMYPLPLFKIDLTFGVGVEPT